MRQYIHPKQIAVFLVHVLTQEIPEISGGANRYVALISISGNHISNSIGDAIKLGHAKTVSAGHNSLKNVVGFCYSIADCMYIAISGDTCNNVNGFAGIDALSSNISVTGNSGEALVNAFSISQSATGVFKANNVFNGTIA